jgi:malate synthase
MPTPNQHHVKREDVQVTRDDLLKPSLGTITRAGFDNNVDVCVRYMAAWLAGSGCVPIHHLMEDAATAEISRTQLWRWLHHPQVAAKIGVPAEPLHLDDGTPVDWALFERALINLPSVIGDRRAITGGERLDAAIALLDRLTHADTLEAFLTSAAYPQLVNL